MYRLAANAGDTVAVPRLLFTKLTAPGANDPRFRVALFLVASGEATPEEVARELHISTPEAEKALLYWEGAGLLEKQAEASPSVAAEPRRRMTTREVTSAGECDALLGGMIGELQRIFGGVVSQSDLNIFVTLYHIDKIPADLILLAASYFGSKGKTSARYIEKTLLSWRRDGICDCMAADRYLQQLALRDIHENEVAELMKYPAASFTLAERKRIAKWYEEYSYGTEMIGAAQLAAGDKSTEIRYLDGILKRWFAKGYQTVRDVQQADGENRNLRVQGDKHRIAPEDDLLLNTTYVPLSQSRRAAE